MFPYYFIYSSFVRVNFTKTPSLDLSIEVSLKSKVPKTCVSTPKETGDGSTEVIVCLFSGTCH